MGCHSRHRKMRIQQDFLPFLVSSEGNLRCPFSNGSNRFSYLVAGCWSCQREACVSITKYTLARRSALQRWQPLPSLHLPHSWGGCCSMGRSSALLLSNKGLLFPHASLALPLKRCQRVSAWSTGLGNGIYGIHYKSFSCLHGNQAAFETRLCGPLPSGERKAASPPDCTDSEALVYAGKILSCLSCSLGNSWSLTIFNMGSVWFCVEQMT